MSKITKTAASETAKLMATNAIDPKIIILKKEQKQIITDVAIRKTPANVLSLYDGNDELKPYFITNEAFRYRCDGLNEDYDTYFATRELPRTHRNNEYLDVEREEYDRLIELKKQVGILNSQKEKLRRKIEATLLSLGTYKRIEKKFPEAYALIPNKFTEPKVDQTIALPIEELKAELLKYSK